MQEDDALTRRYREILLEIGEDPRREGLLDTPKRAAKAMQYLCNGYGKTVEALVNGALFASDTDEMIIVKDIELYSLCEHHLLPFIGKAHVAYMPTGKVLGLSKVARIVDMFARRFDDGVCHCGGALSCPLSSRSVEPAAYLLNARCGDLSRCPMKWHFSA